MIVEGNGTEYDLVPLVKIMTQYEDMNFAQQRNKTFNPFMVTTAYADLTWGETGACALGAIGADVIGMLLKSNLKTWSVILIKRAFKTVAQRLLGPIGVIVAVASFGACLTVEYLD